MSKIKKGLLLALAIFTVGCNVDKEGKGKSVQIFTNGNILTMTDGTPTAEAIAIKDGKILSVGTEEKVKEVAGNEYEIVDLDGKTMMPSFIDAHSHVIPFSALNAWPNLSPAPVGDVKNHEDIIAKLKGAIKEKNIPAGELVFGWGYDDSLLEEKNHPTKDVLDKVSTEHPIVIQHISGHLGAANTKGLEFLGYTKGIKDPEGGVIRRIAGTDEPNGVLEEKAAMAILPHIMSGTMDEQVERLVSAQEYIASKGITTVQDGKTVGAFLDALMTAEKQDKLTLDVVYYPYYPVYDDLNAKYDFKNIQTKKAKFGGVKAFIDGSPQGKTAFFKEHYHVVPEGQDADYRGYSVLDQEKLNEVIDRFYKENIQVLTHTNGDASMEMNLIAIEKAIAKYGMKDHRNVIIHAPLVSEKQMDRAASAKLIPSFFTSHVFYWGDYHRDSVMGPVRAENMSPTRWAAERGMKYNLHTDTPVVPYDPFHLVWSAVNRVTRSGKVLGEGQKLTVEEALKAMTINSAYEYFEEDEKGSIEEGKLADLIIVDKNPLTINSMELKDIQVLETFKEGKSIYKRN